jgi:hypothetical protein
MKIKTLFHPRNILIVLAIFVAGILLMGLVFGLMLQMMPSIGAYGADYLRHIVGEQAVAYLEMGVFKIQDTVKKTEYSFNLVKPVDPWSVSANSGKPTPALAPSATSLKPTLAAGKVETAQPTQQPAWVPPDVTPLGTLQDVGIWQPYINNAAGQVVAYRTFLQPDSNRPYATTAVVAFNLKAVRLHYMIGFEDPYTGDVKRFSQGVIPDKYLKPNILLAVFNGGFKYEHGAFGSMLFDNISVPPTQGYGTVAIYKDGHFQMGEWGKDFTRTLDMASFRQNGPLVIQEGVINPKVDNPVYWGYTITGATVAWRSGIAVDQEYNTLYYFIGPYLTIDTLAQAMAAVHPWNAMQLDINNYWTIFEAFPPNTDKLQPEPLLPKDMNDNLNRFLYPYARDFFYITDAAPPAN